MPPLRRTLELGKLMSSRLKMGCLIDLAQTERRKWYRKPPVEEPKESLKTA
jgi:hypothetical protein